MLTCSICYDYNLIIKTIELTNKHETGTVGGFFRLIKLSPSAAIFQTDVERYFGMPVKDRKDGELVYWTSDQINDFTIKPTDDGFTIYFPKAKRKSLQKKATIEIEQFCLYSCNEYLTEYFNEKTFRNLAVIMINSVNANCCRMAPWKDYHTKVTTPFLNNDIKISYSNLTNEDVLKLAKFLIDQSMEPNLKEVYRIEFDDEFFQEEKK